MSVPPDTRKPIDAPDARQDIKSGLRRSLLALRCSLDDEKRREWDQKISRYLEVHLEKRAITTLGAYFSTRNEPDLMALYDTLFRKGITLFLPVVVEKAAPLQFVKWTPGDPLAKDSYGILTPETRDFVPLPQALLVPCLGFTPDRFRLGYGGGYFDRTLEETPRPHTIGIAYSCLKSDFPIQAYDIALDCIITENGTI